MLLSRMLFSALLCARLCVGHSQDLRFQVLSTDDGLSDNAVNCVHMDRAGYIWIGTEKGLDRFDGQRVDRISGAPFPISFITEDASGVLWASTKDHGLLRLDTPNRRVSHFRHNDHDARSIPSDQLTSVFDLDDTTLLIGSRELTLLFMDKRSHAFTYWTDSLDLSPAKASRTPSGHTGWCHAITPLDDRHIWIGLLNSHTALLADRGTNRIVRHISVKREGSETQTCALLHQGIFYNGGWQNGIDRMPFTALEQQQLSWQPTPTVIPTPDEALSFAALPDGSVLAGTRAFGVMRILPGQQGITLLKRRRTDPYSLPSDRVRCLSVDRTGTLWVGTSNGLAYHVPAVWSIATDRIFNAQDDQQPELFFHRIEAHGEHGIRAYTSNGFYTQPTPNAAITHQPLFRNGMDLQPTVSGRSNDGRAILGTEYGIVIGDPTGGGSVEDFVIDDGLSTKYTPGAMFQVRYLNPDTFHGRPVLVIGTMGFGVNVVDPTTGRLIMEAMPMVQPSLKARALVTSMARGDDGLYRVATADGIYTWDLNIPLKEPISGAPLLMRPDSILITGAAVLQMKLYGDTAWAVTRDARLLRVIDRQVTAFNVPWTVGSLHGLESDRQGRLWITTDDGLVRFDPRDTSFIRVPVNDSREFRKLTRAITSLPDGRIVFATSNTLLSFRPEVFDTLPPVPRPYLNHISLAGDSLSIMDGRVELSYRATALDIGVSALAIGLPKALIFEYRMEGVEDEWRSTDARTPIRYAGIPIGRHRLLVRVVDPFGRPGPPQALVTVVVIGPIWQQWWFYALAVVLITAGLYVLYRYRLAQAFKLQSVRNRIASDLHDEVGSSLSSITIGSQLAAQLTGQSNDQVKEILGRIGETSSESLRSMSDIVWAVDPKNDQGEALIKRMRRIANELLESKGIDVSFNVGRGVDELKLPMNTRKEIVLIYKEAIHNASKYSGARIVQVSLHQRNGSLSISVKDDGKGFDPALHPDGHGLGSMRRRAASLGSSLLLRSAVGMGSFVGLEVDTTRIRD